MALSLRLAPPKLRVLQASAAAEPAAPQQILLSARRLAETAFDGRQPRRRRGASGDFWQFRLYQRGEDISAIDWRRSARGRELFLREREQETAQAVCLVADMGRSMRYQSRGALCSKEERALLWQFLLAELLLKSGQKVGAPGLLPPSASRAFTDNLAEALSARQARQEQPDALSAAYADVPRFAHCLIISDFLDDLAAWRQVFALLAEKRAHIGLIAIADPAERDFPFSGDTLFREPKSGAELRFGRAQSLRAAYLARYRQNRAELAALCSACGAALLEDCTNAPLSQSLAHSESFLRQAGAG